MRKTFPYYLYLIALLNLFSIKINGQNESVMDTVEVNSSNSQNAESANVKKDYNDTLISVYRPLPFDTVEAISNDKGFYYKRYMDSLLKALQKNAPVKRKNSFSFTSVPGLIFLIPAIGILFFLIYKLFLGNSSLFIRNRKNNSAGDQTMEEVNPDNLEAMVQKAISDGDYRLAVRYLYLFTLQMLANKKFIETGADKTNHQYVHEIRKQAFANEFASLTLKYEYIWYGEYPVNENLFDQVHTEFTNFNRTINR